MPELTLTEFLTLDVTTRVHGETGLTKSRLSHGLLAPATRGTVLIPKALRVS